MTAEKMNVVECKSSKKVLVMAILFKSSIGIGIGNTFCQSIVTGIDNSFHTNGCWGLYLKFWAKLT